MDKPVLDEASIGDAISAGRTPVMQFWKPDYDPALLERLDALCQRHGPRLGVRFYGHAGGAFDAGVLRRLPSVQNLAIDRLERVVNEDAIGALRHLRRFSFGVATLDRPDFLSWLDLANIEVLKLAETKRRNFDLGPLARVNGGAKMCRMAASKCTSLVERKGP